MYNVNPFPPPFGVCSICHKHDCGVSPDGEKWIQIPLELFVGGDIHIGYNCIKSMSDNMGITQEVVEREVFLTPTDEQIGDFVRKAINQMDRQGGSLTLDELKDQANPELLAEINGLNRNELKSWLGSRKVSFVPQWGEERLRGEALKHV